LDFSAIVNSLLLRLSLAWQQPQRLRDSDWGHRGPRLPSLGARQEKVRQNRLAVYSVGLKRSEMEIPVQSGQDGKWFISALKHPLVLLLIGSVLSYLLIPWISEKSSHKRLLQEKRVDRACDVLQQGLIDDLKLNSIQTAFEMFNKEAESDPKSYKTAQAELKNSFNKLYFEFDQHAWWWDHDLPVQSKLLELPSGSKEKIEQLHDVYKKNLLDSVEQLDVLRAHFLAKDYKPREPHNTEVLLATRRALNDLATNRGAITFQLAFMFMPPRFYS
jgi:hypothetical protein